MTLTRTQLEVALASGLATEDDFAGYTPDQVLQIKRALPSMQRVGGRPLGMDEETQTIRLIYNAQVVDRMRDLILSNPKDAEKYGGEGWILDYWQLAGSPYIHMHDPHYPIGRCLSCKVERVPTPERDGGKKVWALVGDTKIIADERIPFALPTYLLMLEGITASSVGFLPKMYVRIEDEKERARLGVGEWGLILPQNEMLEVSFAPTPANQLSVGVDAGAPEKAVDQALSRFVKQGKLPESLASDYRRFMPLGPDDSARRVAERLRSVVPIAKALGWLQPDGVTLQCTQDGCVLVGPENDAEPAAEKASCACHANGAESKAASQADLDAIQGRLEAATELATDLSLALLGLADAVQMAKGGGQDASDGKLMNGTARRGLLDTVLQKLVCLDTRVAALAKAQARGDAGRTPAVEALSGGDAERQGAPEAAGEGDDVTASASQADGDGVAEPALVLDDSVVAGFSARLRQSRG